MEARTKILMCLLAMAVAQLHAQGPNNTGNYYSPASGTKGEALKTALYNIIKNPSVTSYAGLKEAYTKTDVRADGYLRDWYSNTTHYEPGSAFAPSYKKEGDGYNREHSVPQSWFSKASPMVSDVVHVFPVDAWVNGVRADYPFGEVGTVSKQSAGGYSKLGKSKSAGYTGTVFEPNDEVKGDIARIYFYMATCYEDRINGWTGESFTGTTKYKPFAQWTLDVLMRWSEADPVDEVETARNAAIQEVQKNRNPFVDYPGLEQYVWGTLANQAFSYDNYGSPTHINGVFAQGERTIGHRVYDLHGQRLGKMPTRRGIYLRNGRKFVVR